MRTNRSRYLALVLVILVSLALVPVVTAQDDDPVEETPPVSTTITGVVEAVGDGVVTIDGVIYWVSEEVDASIFVVGEPITIEVLLADDVTMTIIAAHEPTEEELEELEESDDISPEEKHPVAAAIAAGVGADYEDIMEWAEHNLGFGEIARAYLIADAADVTVEEVLSLKIDQGMGWGEILKFYDLKASDLGSIGHLINGKLTLVDPEDLPEDVDPDGTLNSQDVDATDDTEINKFGCPGRGNSCNAPGHNKDD